MAPIGAAGPQCLAGSPQQACHTEPHHQPKTAPTQHRAPLNTCLSGAQQAPRSAWSAPREVSHCLARASGNCATNCPALEASEVDIRGKPPIPPKGALMQTLFACDSPPPIAATPLAGAGHASMLRVHHPRQSLLLPRRAALHAHRCP